MVGLLIVLVSVGVGVMALAPRVGLGHLWAISISQYLPYPVYLLPALCALMLSVLVGWPLRLLAAAGLAVAVFSLMGLEINQGDPGPKQLRVMTFNVKDYITFRRGGGTDVAEEIARHDPDVLVLQDARRLSDGVARPRVRAVFGEREVYGFGQYVVASRFPLRECRTGWISFRDEPHTYVTCVVSTPDGEFDLYTAHFMTPRDGLLAAGFDPVAGVREWEMNVSDRMTQARTLADHIRQSRRPVIVAGDLNAPEASPVIQTLLATGLRDAFSVAGQGFGFTWGHSLRPGVPFLRIDHILVGPQFRVIASVVGAAAGSAHRPVVADLAFDAAQE